MRPACFKVTLAAILALATPATADTLPSPWSTKTTIGPIATPPAAAPQPPKAQAAAPAPAAVSPAPPAVKVVTPAPAPAPAPPALVDINTAASAALDHLPKIGAARARTIIAGRPYKSVEELLSRKILPADAFAAVKSLVAVK